MRLTRVGAIIRKEWHEILRDRISLLLAFLLPTMVMVVMGYGLTQDVQNISLAVLDEDRTLMSRDYARRYSESRYFDFVGYLDSAGDADRLLAAGRVRVVLVIPENFQKRLLAGRPVQVQTLLDGTFTRPTRTIRGYVEAINSAASRAQQVAFLARHLGLSLERAQVLLEPVTMEVRYLYNQELQSVWFFAPSLIMLAMMLSAPLLMALSVVREKEFGTIYNIYAATATRGEYLAGKLVPNVAISFANVVVLWVIARHFFGAPFKGSLGFFLLAAVPFVLCASAIGLVVSLLVSTQQAALIVVVIISMVTTFQYSGMLEPTASMARLDYVIAHLLPPLYFNNIVQGTFLKGSGARLLWPDVLALSVYAGALLAAAHALFHKRTIT